MRALSSRLPSASIGRASLEAALCVFALCALGLCASAALPCAARAQGDQEPADAYPTPADIERLEERHRETAAPLRPEETELLRRWNDGPDPDDALSLIALGVIALGVGLPTLLIGALGIPCFSARGSCDSVEENPDAVTAGSVVLGLGFALLAAGFILNRVLAAEAEAHQARVRRWWREVTEPRAGISLTPWLSLEPSGARGGLALELRWAR